MSRPYPQVFFLSIYPPWQAIPPRRLLYISLETASNAAIYPSLATA